MNILFICSKNEWRSRTAETIFKNHGVHQIKSAGTSVKARIKVSQQLIHWADLIVAMEYHHKRRLVEQFRPTQELIVLEISDDYQYMNQELIEMLEDAMAAYL